MLTVSQPVSKSTVGTASARMRPRVGSQGSQGKMQRTDTGMAVVGLCQLIQTIHYRCAISLGPAMPSQLEAAACMAAAGLVEAVAMAAPEGAVVVATLVVVEVLVLVVAEAIFAG